MSIDYSNMMFPKSTTIKNKAKNKDISKTNRDKIKNLFKGKCGLCGRQGIQIHHIVYRSEDKSKIDDIGNLFLLCLECHAKVHSNKKYWQLRLKNLREKFNK